MQQYRTSFYTSDLGSFEYHGPWWISGYTSEDSPIIVAAVMANSEKEAYETLRLAFDEDKRPAKLKERFCEKHDGSPFSDRFPQAGWMQWPWPIEPLKPRP